MLIQKTRCSGSNVMPSPCCMKLVHKKKFVAWMQKLILINKASTGFLSVQFKYMYNTCSQYRWSVIPKCVNLMALTVPLAWSRYRPVKLKKSTVLRHSLMASVTWPATPKSALTMATIARRDRILASKLIERILAIAFETPPLPRWWSWGQAVKHYMWGDQAKWVRICQYWFGNRAEQRK